jgi:hypothetical protein
LGGVEKQKKPATMAGILIADEGSSGSQLPKATRRCLKLFSERFQTTSAKMFTNFAVAFINGCPLNIGFKLTLRLFLREAHVVARHRSFATHITFSHHFTST